MARLRRWADSPEPGRIGRGASALEPYRIGFDKSQPG